MGPNRVAGLTEGRTEVDRVVACLTADDAPAASRRARIAALVRHVAALRSLPGPAAFDDDPPTPVELSEALGRLGNDRIELSTIGSTWELLLDDADRRSKGAHFTAPLVARRVCGLAFDALGSELSSGTTTPLLWDPACGGGAFLLAAATLIEERYELDRSTIVGGLHASDIDATALDVCRACLELWSGTQVEPVTVLADALLDLPSTWPSEFDLVVGNPPFLGQLSSATSRTTDRRAQLVAQFSSANSAYVDDAGLFVELALMRARDGGVVGLIIPESILGARDAEPMRLFASESGELTHLWIGDADTFRASVDVVAVVFRRTGASPAARTESATTTQIHTRMLPAGSNAAPTIATTPSPASWAPLLAAALEVPSVALSGKHGTLGDVADVTAGFRQHFYGIADAVIDGEPTSSTPRLVTAGAIDPLHLLWGSGKTRFAKRSFTSPVLVLDEVDDPRVREWFVERCRPKLLLASQTRVVELIVDTDGSCVPSVPVVSVEPTNTTSLWHLGAALSSPAVSSWLVAQSAGTGLSRDAVRVRAATLARVALPKTGPEWDAGAHAAQRAYEASSGQDMAQYVSALRDLAVAMNAAYCVETHVASWWWERLRLPPGFTTTRFESTE